MPRFVVGFFCCHILEDLVAIFSSSSHDDVVKSTATESVMNQHFVWTATNAPWLAMYLVLICPNMFRRRLKIIHWLLLLNGENVSVFRVFFLLMSYHHNGCLIIAFPCRHETSSVILPLLQVARTGWAGLCYQCPVSSDVTSVCVSISMTGTYLTATWSRKIFCSCLKKKKHSSRSVCSRGLHGNVPMQTSSLRSYLVGLNPW